MCLLVELEKIHEWCIVIMGGDTKVFQVSLVIGIRCYIGMAFGLGGPILHAGWDMKTKVGVVWLSICYSLQIRVPQVAQITALCTDVI